VHTFKVMWSVLHECMQDSFVIEMLQKVFKKLAKVGQIYTQTQTATLCGLPHT